MYKHCMVCNVYTQHRVFCTFCIKHLLSGMSDLFCLRLPCCNHTQMYGMQQQQQNRKKRSEKNEKKKNRKKSKPTSIYSELKISHSEAD